MKKIISIILGLVFLASCENDDYLIGGDISEANVDMSTVDFFESHSQLDTLAYLIKKANMEDVYNQENSTVFAPNNNSIKQYINKILTEKRKLDPLAEFGLDDISSDTLKKYMGGYVFDAVIKRENMTEQGEIYTAINGEERSISLEPVDQYTNQLQEYPEYVFIDFLLEDSRYRIRTSNIETTNGVVHVIQGNYVLFNYE